MFKDKNQWYIEIISEVLLMLVSVILQQFLLYNNSDDIKENLNISVYTSLGLLLFLNTVFLVYGVIIDCKEGKRTKAIKAAKLKYE